MSDMIGYLAKFIKCRGLWFDKSDDKTKFVKGVFYINPNDINAVFPSDTKKQIEGRTVMIYSVQTSFERMNVVSEELDSVFGHHE